MFEVSHRLIGIYKVANATKSECFIPNACSAVPTVCVVGVSIDNFALNTPALVPAPQSHAGPPPSTIRPAGSVKFTNTPKPQSTSVRA